MGLFDLFKSDDNKDGDDGNPLKLLLSALTGDGDSKGQNPLALLFKALISFIKSLFSPDPNTPGYEESGAPPGAGGKVETPEQLEARNTIEAKAAPVQFNDSVKGFTPQEVVRIPHQLDALREASERANGGQKIISISPVAEGGRIRSDFGEREIPMPGASHEHKGLDIAPMEPGKQNVGIRAPMPGVVVGAGWKSGYGNTVDILDIYGTTHRFGHLAKIDVQRGQQVSQGEHIAVMGMTGRATGIHLHYEQRDSNQAAFDPVINGKNNYKTNDTLPETGTALASLNSPSKGGNPSSVEAQLAQLGLSGVTLDSGQYVPPPAGKGQGSSRTPG